MALISQSLGLSKDFGGPVLPISKKIQCVSPSLLSSSEVTIFFSLQTNISHTHITETTISQICEKNLVKGSTSWHLASENRWL